MVLPGWGEESAGRRRATQGLLHKGRMLCGLLRWGSSVQRTRRQQGLLRDSASTCQVLTQFEARPWGLVAGEDRRSQRGQVGGDQHSHVQKQDLDFLG